MRFIWRHTGKILSTPREIDYQGEGVWFQRESCRVEEEEGIHNNQWLRRRWHREFKRYHRGKSSQTTPLETRSSRRLMQSDAEWSWSDAKVDEGSLGCHNFSRRRRNFVSGVFSQKYLNFSMNSFLVKQSLLKVNKTLICCTSFPTLGFSGDNCPKITVLMWLILVLVYHYYFIYVIMW